MIDYDGGGKRVTTANNLNVKAEKLMKVMIDGEYYYITLHSVKKIN